jgi:hypothetical protein
MRRLRTALLEAFSDDLRVLHLRLSQQRLDPVRDRGRGSPETDVVSTSMVSWYQSQYTSGYVVRVEVVGLVVSALPLVISSMSYLHPLTL